MGLIIIMIRYLLLMVALIEAATAVTHQVGDSTGWDVPASPSFYTTWADSQNFSVGDILEFKWTSTHDVLEVMTKTEYDDCTQTNGVPSNTTGPVSVTLNSTTPRYFICTIGSHCTLGQKLAVTKVATNTTTTPTTSPPPPSGSTTSPPPPSGSTTSPPPPSGSSASMPTAALLPALLSTIAIISFLITM